LVARGLGNALLTQRTVLERSYEDLPYATRELDIGSEGLGIEIMQLSGRKPVRRMQAFIDVCREAVARPATPGPRTRPPATPPTRRTRNPGRGARRAAPGHLRRAPASLRRAAMARAAGFRARREAAGARGRAASGSLAFRFSRSLTCSPGTLAARGGFAGPVWGCDRPSHGENSVHCLCLRGIRSVVTKSDCAVTSTLVIGRSLVKFW